ncbi:MAG: type III pantothenate kinase [Humidesulfovibrio sp.]|uniref:type III pantothenate kinase n=1 Tax=Humidesulfovibrio sp. TaxID=2910988 RepID=UPI0027358114|nr:type III pantothenate kinase [Humidesulfovibrio sp.]MDP2849313.1 type III pantothenate kinase [Humidesulfovibrio sp.]
MDTVILLDVGNTNVKVGLARPGQGLISCYALPTAPSGNVGTSDGWGLKLLDICRVENVTPGEVAGFVASSVVPPMNPVLSRAAARFFDRQVHFAPGDIPIPIENRYARPAEVGADRLVTAYAARQLSSAPALVVVDFGTATTFDCVVGEAFVGGLICPGVLSSARALATGTAKLPHITLETGPARADGGLDIGTSTSQSLNIGLIHGFAAMVDGLARRLAATLLPGREAEVRLVATGGFAARIAEVCPAIHEVREDLLMEGLWRAWLASR